MFANLSPCKGKSFKEPDDYKAFALTGRIADCHYPQGAALGLELLPFQGVYALNEVCMLMNEACMPMNEVFFQGTKKSWNLRR